MSFGKQSLRRLFCLLALGGFLYLAVADVILPLLMHGALEDPIGGHRFIVSLLQFIAGFCLLFPLRRDADDRAFQSLNNPGSALALAMKWIYQDLKRPRSAQARRELAVVFLPFVPLLAYKAFLSTFLFFPLILVYIAGIAYVARECFWRLCVAR